MSLLTAKSSKKAFLIILLSFLCLPVFFAAPDKFKGLWPWDRKMTVVEEWERNPFQPTASPTQIEIIELQKIEKRIAELTAAAQFEVNDEKRGELLIEAIYLKGRLDCLKEYRDKIFNE
jgi:hypothetical protein